MDPINSLLKVFSIVLLLIVYDYADANSDNFLYIDHLNKRSINIDLGRSKYGLEDVVYPLTECPPDSPYKCFSSAILSFAVPKDPSRSLLTWRHQGMEYSYVEEKFIGTLGSNVFKVKVIESIQDGVKAIFYYSDRTGLLAIGFVGDAGSTFFIGTKGSGFGASTEAAYTQDPSETESHSSSHSSGSN